KAAVHARKPRPRLRGPVSMSKPSTAYTYTRSRTPAACTTPRPAETGPRCSTWYKGLPPDLDTGDLGGVRSGFLPGSRWGRAGRGRGRGVVVKWERCSSPTETERRSSHGAGQRAADPETPPTAGLFARDRQAQGRPAAQPALGRVSPGKRCGTFLAFGLDGPGALGSGTLPRRRFVSGGPDAAHPRYRGDRRRRYLLLQHGRRPKGPGA